MKYFRNKGLLFGIAYTVAILGWFSYTALNGIDMLAFAKSDSWNAKGIQYYSATHK